MCLSRTGHGLIPRSDWPLEQVGAFQEAEPSLLNYCADDSYDVMMIDGPFQEDGLSLFWNISLETVKGLLYLVLDYPPPYFATVSLISLWSTLYVCLMKPKRFASMDVSSNQRGLQQIRSLLTISLRASIDRVCGLSLLQIRLHAQQIQIQMLSKYKYKCTLMLRSCDQCLGHCGTFIIQLSFDQNIFKL